jgi:hypothetical protein
MRWPTRFAAIARCSSIRPWRSTRGAGGGRRSATLVQARDAGLEPAQQELDRLDAPALGRWTHYWFGAQARPGHRVTGTILVAVAALALTAPLLQ